MSRRRSLLCAGAILCSYGSATGAAWAADPLAHDNSPSAERTSGRAAPALDQSTTPAAAAGTPTAGVEEVVVTTRKRAEKLTKVPVSVTALTKKDLREKNIHGMSGIADFSPGFKYQSQTVNRNDRGFQSFALRGITPGSSSTRQTSGVFMDGTPIAGGNISGVTDIDHVEVIRGPQSAYFGRATFAGAINLITRPPGDKLRTTVDAEYGSYDTTDDSAAVEGAIVPGKLDFRLSGRHYRTAGQYNDALEPGVKLGERETNSGTFELHATPTDRLTVNYFFNYWTDDDGPSAQALLGPGSYNCNKAGGKTPNYICGGISGTPQASMLYNTLPGDGGVLSLLTAPSLVGGERAISPSIIDAFGLSRRAYETHITATQYLPHDYSLSANIARDQNNWSAVNDTLYQNTFRIANPNYGKIPGVLPYNSRTALSDAPDWDWSAEVRLASPQTGRLKWLLGANYYQQRSSVSTVGYSTAGVFQPSNYTHYNSDTGGVFGSISYEIVKNLNLSLEGRGQWDKIESFATLAAGNGPRFRETYPSFSPRAILSYNVTPETMVYTSFARGYRPGEFNANYQAQSAAVRAQIVRQLGQVATAIPQEKINMLEVGVKGLYLQKRLRLLLDAYYGDWSNIHISDNVTTNTNGVLSTIPVIVPGGRVLLHGFEGEGSFAVTRHLTIGGTFDYAATNIRRDYCAQCATIDGLVNNTGTSEPNYPTYSGTASVTYSHPIFNDRMTGFVHADYIYTGRQYADVTNVLWTNPSHRLNAIIGVQKGPYEVDLVGTNLTDNKVPTNIAQTTNSLTGGNTVVISPAEKPYYGFRVHVSL